MATDADDQDAKPRKDFELTGAGLASLLGTCSAISLLLAAHPFTTYPASLAAYRALAKPRRTEGGAEAPTLALLVSCHNEVGIIARKAENLIACAKTVPGTAIFVYVDGATDGTLEALAPFGGDMTIVDGRTQAGKSHGLEILVRRCEADVLVFTDATVMMAPDALARLAARFRDPQVGLVSGYLNYQGVGESPTARVGGGYWRIEETIQQLESDTIGMVGVDGSMFAVRRSLRPHVPPDLIDDFTVSMEVALNGHKVIKADDAYAYELVGSKRGEEYSRKVRIACRSFNAHKAIWPRVVRSRPGLAYGYVSHRVLKWLVGYNLMAGCILGIAAAYASLPALDVTVGLTLCAALGLAAVRLGLPGTRLAVATATALAGVSVGVAKSMRGERFQTWNLQSSARPGVKPPKA